MTSNGTLSSMRRPLSVQVFIVAPQGGEFRYLLFLRREMPELGLPAFWQGITGALEAGESFAEAAIREVREESGISLGEVYQSGFVQHFPIRPEWRKAYGDGPSPVEEHVYFALLPAPVAPVLSAEHETSRWCQLEEAAELLTFGRNRECLLAAEVVIRCRGEYP